MANRQPPTVKELMSYDVNRLGQVEGIWQPLYDSGTYTSATTTVMNFFQQGLGTATKTLVNTNLEGTGGVLPNPIQFLITAISFAFFPGLNPARAGLAPAALDGDFVNDVYSFMKAGFVKLHIGNKDYLYEAPMGRCPPTFRMAGWGALSDSTTAGAAQGAEASYAAIAGPIYEVTPLRLISNQNFNLSLNTPTPITFPSAQNAIIYAYLHGFQYRLSQ